MKETTMLRMIELLDMHFKYWTESRSETEKAYYKGLYDMALMILTENHTEPDKWIDRTDNGKHEFKQEEPTTTEIIEEDVTMKENQTTEEQQEQPIEAPTNSQPETAQEQSDNPTEATTEPETVKFEAGKRYYCSSACNHESVYVFEVIKRTDKTITICRVRNDELEEPERKKIKLHNNVEYCNPLGVYSMCPCLNADSIVHYAQEQGQPEPEHPEQITQPIEENPPERIEEKADNTKPKISVYFAPEFEEIAEIYRKLKELEITLESTPPNAEKLENMLAYVPRKREFIPIAKLICTQYKRKTSRKEANALLLAWCMTGKNKTGGSS